MLLSVLTPTFSQNEETPLSKTTLQLLRASDMEGGIEALENVPRFSSVLAIAIFPVRFSAGNNQSLREVLGREGPGRVNILMLNAMGFMTCALGNH